MKKRLISLIVAVVMLFSMLCPAAYADDGTVSFDTCSHEWETPIRSGYSYTIPNTDVSFGVKVEQCKKCKWYKHVASIIIAEYTYYSPFNVDENGLIPTELATVWANVWYKTFGKNATAEKFTPGGGSTDGSGVGRRPAGYADDNGTALIDSSGRLTLSTYHLATYFDTSISCKHKTKGQSNSSYSGTFVCDLESSEPVNIQVESADSGNFGGTVTFVWTFTAPVNGWYSLASPVKITGYQIDSEGVRSTLNGNFISLWEKFGFSEKTFKCSSLSDKTYFSSGTKVVLQITGNTSYRDFSYNSVSGVYKNITCIAPIMAVEPVSTVVNQQTNITINNNTWNGNIYTDNSTNLTYIYPQYTTVNEKNETVTNISTNPIIYNNETKQYYTYDQTTKNYYYINYGAAPTPTPAPTETPTPSPEPTEEPSPSPTPAPTDKPGGSISTPETGEPGGDTGDTTGIVAVLVEIRDNMIQGFLDIKAAFVAGFADLSANFTLAIENLNLNITNIFNKKFPDQSTPETALPSPTPDVSPSPTPSTPETGEPSPSPSPSPTPDPDATPSPSPAPTSKPDSGDKTNNFWTIIFPNGGGSEDGKKGIFWALVSLILALIAFFSNLAVGVGYLFPFLPDGVVMTINTCLIVIFLFTIIKFIMRSK